MGRPTKEQEIAEFLEESGLDPALLQTDMPETFAEMRDAFMQLIWANKASLKGTALVQALNALARLAEANKADDEAKNEPEPLVADIIAGVLGLSRERRDEILRRELAKLDTERARIQEVLAGD